MNALSADDLVAKARALEDEAIEAGDDSAPGRKLRSQAAKLRVEALGDKVYPVVVCSSCFRVTGWVDASGRCDHCLRHAQLEAAYSDPHGGWVSVADTRSAHREGGAPTVPLGVRLAALVGRRGDRDRVRAAAWRVQVDPGVTGPVSPEDGFEVEGAHRDEVDAADGSGVLIRFSTATHRFADSGWQRLATTRIAGRDLLAPGEVSAGLPVEQLTAAWSDYQITVETINRAAWAAASGARDAERQAHAAHDETMAEQRHASDLLEEGR
jgi:hypothetical protein